MMDHHYGMGGFASFDGMLDKYYSGRKPNGGFYIPRFRNIDEATRRTDYIRGFGYQGGLARVTNVNAPIGPDFKEAISSPGEWQFNATCFGELLPYHDNKMMLSDTETDQYGIPKLIFDAGLKENETKLRADGGPSLR